MNHRIFVVQSRAELEICYPVMKELRPHLEFEDYIAIYNQAHMADGYEIVAIESDQKIVAVMGYRFLSDFVRGKHIYIDDLVVSSVLRSQGLGAQLLKYAEDIARKSDCKSLRLCTGLENDRGIRFYDSNGWVQRAFAYTKKVSG